MEVLTIALPLEPLVEWFAGRALRVRLADPQAPERRMRVLLAAAELGLRRYVDKPDLHAPAAHRVAFRELGLAIGLAANAAMEPAVTARFARYLPLRDELPAFWLRPDHRRTRAWIEHADINDVMLATSLVPDGFVTLYGLTGR